MNYFIFLKVKSLQCVQCSTDTDPHCKCNPPPPRECITAMYDHCITVKEKDNQGKVTVFTRSCSPEDLKDECITGRTPEGKFKKICYTTCTSDGCNKEELINDCEPGSRTEEEIAKLKGLKEKVIEEAEKKKETIDENVKKIDEKIESEIGKIKAKSGAFSSIKFCISGTLLMAFNVFFVILLNL
ncbi:unnamed protein product [Gordionus sp. m RMFG-2023]